MTCASPLLPLCRSDVSCIGVRKIAYNLMTKDALLGTLLGDIEAITSPYHHNMVEK